MALEGLVFSLLVVGPFLALLAVPLEPWLRVGADPSSPVLRGEVSGPLVRWSGLRLLPVERSGGLYYLFSKRVGDGGGKAFGLEGDCGAG